MNGTLGFSAGTVGHTYRWAFPLLKNSGTSPVTVTSFAMERIPANFQILGYPVYSQHQVGDYVAAFTDQDLVGVPNLLTKADYAGQPIVIAPGQQSDRYAMVAVKLLQNTTDPITGCVVFYKIGKVKHRQRFDCQFQVGG